MTRQQLNLKTNIILRNRLHKYWDTADDWKNSIKDRNEHACFYYYANINSLPSRAALDAFAVLSMHGKQGALLHLNSKIWQLKRGNTPPFLIKFYLSYKLLLRKIRRIQPILAPVTQLAE